MSYRLVINPELRLYNFVSQADPYSAYQEIERYIGNDLVQQEDPTNKISDEIKRDLKGFNDWSFKRHKTESKKYKGGK